MPRQVVAFVAAFGLALGLAACGQTPSQPSPNPNPNPTPSPSPQPVNTAPVIESITVQGTRRNQPASFADVSESVPVSARVTDAETAVEQLTYNWTATAGTFTGTGAQVTWQAPAAAQTPMTVTLTLEIVERYGTGQEHRVTRTAPVALHDSIKEVGDMSRQFLIDFSNTLLKNTDEIMRNFGTAAICPHPNELTDERDQVTNHYRSFVVHQSTIGGASVNVNFGGSCYAGLRGDACASVPVAWDSTELSTNRRGTTQGIDHLTAVYSKEQTRWWLCSSRFAGTGSLAHRFYLR